MWVMKANSKSLLREESSEARKAREGQWDCAEAKLERWDLWCNHVSELQKKYLIEVQSRLNENNLG